MLSVDDAAKLNIPLGMFISNDESKEEVCIGTSSTEISCSRCLQYQKIVDVVSKKPFADKNASRIFDS